MNQTISVARIRASELPRVQALAHTIWPECFRGLLADKIPSMLDAVYALPVLEADMNAHGHVFWIARLGEQDVGYAAAYMEADGYSLCLRKLYLLSECRGKGIGKALITTACAHFPRARRLVLNVNSGNCAAIDFYRAQGFSVDAKVPVQMGSFAFEDYIMSKPLHWQT